ncbi:ribonuclease H family protein [Lysinibacillus sp. BPa_S21]|uniref:ribonuclease H family protein n=1 Tax=Lysinibacillus sp. BPa_S21 TaxID=2932478 RepID=UPI0020124EE7|nr:ribonuclease H family protein [Lysinibacillus sp. BPa_S21]MCL1696368.1 ribonuclease H-like domain-containing protein [Lysinibacillus sp. BPa_S21]
MIKIYTDGSYKDGSSTHHYFVMKGNKRIKRRTFIGFDESSNKAEATTIIKALQMALKKGWEGVTIHTDSLTTVYGVKHGKFNNEDFRYIAHLLKVTKSNILWKNRRHYRIKKADIECRKMMKTKLRRVV